MDAKLKRTQMMKDGPIRSTLITLAIPSIIAMLVTAMYNFIDTLFVGMLHDTNAMAGVSIGFPLFIMITAMGMLVGIGASSYAGRKLGSNEKEMADRTAGLAMVMGVVIALVTMVVGLVFLEPILNLMGATAQVMPYAKVYSGWLLIGSVFSIINMVFNNLMRTEGAAKRSMQTLIIGALINIVLDPIFMFDWGLGMGLGGAAAATVVSQAASTVFCLFYFGRKKSTFTINRATLFHKTSEDATIVKEIFKVGAPVLMMQMLSSIAFGILNSAAGVYGAAPLASLGIVNKIYMIVLQIIMGYVQAFLPFTAYNIGAKQYGRVKEALSFSLMLCGGIGLGATILFQLFPEFFVSMFSNDPEVLVLGVNCLRAQTYLLLPLAFIQTMTALFQASGKAKEAGILSIGRQGVFLIPLVIVLPTLFANNVPSILEALVTHPMEPGLYGVMFAQPIADVISMILCLFLAKKTFGELNQKVAEKEECLQEQRAY